MMVYCGGDNKRKHTACNQQKLKEEKTIPKAAAAFSVSITQNSKNSGSVYSQKHIRAENLIINGLVLTCRGA